MSDSNQGGNFTGRRAVVSGIAGAAATAAIASTASTGDHASSQAPRKDAADRPENQGETRTASTERLPVVFVPHGGGPWPFVDLPFGEKSELDALARYLRGVSALPKTQPKAVLVVSAHWEEPVPTVMTSEHPPMLYDYYGFPPESYEITWPAPGCPALAPRIAELVGAAGFTTATNAQRGFDHGTFVPLKLMYPDADVPTVQLSLKRGLDPAEHLAMGRALAPLRDEGVFIIGSGMTFHNLRAFGPQSRPAAEAFDGWLRETAALDEAARNRGLTEWASAPAARLVHPREEHLLPLMVVAGAAGSDRATIPYNGTIVGLRLSAYHFGASA